MDEVAARPDRSPGPSPEAHDRRLRPPTLRVSMLIGAAILLGLVLYLGRDALGPFILGLFLVYLLDPAVTRLQRRLRLPRWLGILLVYATIVIGLVLVLRLTLPPLVEQLSRLVAQLPTLTTTWIAGLEQAIRDLDLLPPSVRDELIRSLEELSDSLTEGLAGSGLAQLLESLVLTLVGPVARIVTSLFAYLVIPIFVFYLLKDRAALVASIHRAMPDAWEPDVRAVSTIVDRVFGRWLRGQLILGFVVGLATFLGLELLAIVIDPVFGEFAVLLAILAGILELVPIIGPIISAIPMILIGATVSVEAALAAFLLALAIQQVENNILVPKIQGDATDLHPAIVIAGIVIGGSIGGILGAILALPVSAAFRDVVRYLFRRLDPVPVDVETALADALRPADWRLPPAPPMARAEASATDAATTDVSGPVEGGRPGESPPTSVPPTGAA